MITIEGLTVRYPNAETDALQGVNLAIEEGELALVIGPTGGGKSTLLRSINNLVPNFSGGRRIGRIRIDGVDTTRLQPRELADRVGWVAQDPAAGFVSDTVAEELAYSIEQLGLPASQLRVRVEETLDLLGIADLRSRPLDTLSGGEQQRVAIGSVLTSRPKVLLLDEPTSALDPGAAEEVIAVLQRLVSDLGTTVVLAEHRIERVLEHADSVIRILPDRTVRHQSPAAAMQDSIMVPAVVELGRRLGWRPLPLTVRDGRRAAAPLRRDLPVPVQSQHAPGPRQSALILSGRGIVVRYGKRVAVGGVDLLLRGGEVVALMGRNGSGKSSLLLALHGAVPAAAGTIRVNDRPRRREDMALVPQTPTDLFYLPTVAAECSEADAAAGLPAGTTALVLQQLAGSPPPQGHPRDLSAGQQLALALAIQLAPAHAAATTGVVGSRSAIVLLDEPTRGLDLAAKKKLAEVVGDLAAAGGAVLIATHDVEFVARCCSRTVVMAGGDLVTDGPTREVLPPSPLLAPQTAKVLAPLPYLIPDEVPVDD